MEQRAQERHVELMAALHEWDRRMHARLDRLLEYAELREKVAVLDAERPARQRTAS